MESFQKTHNPLLAYFLILLSFFVLLFFTKNIFESFQIVQDSKEEYTVKKQDFEKQLTELNTIQTQLQDTSSETFLAIQPFLAPFSDADILEYIYSYAQRINLGSERIIIREVNLEERGKNDIGFLHADVTVTAIFSSEEALFGFLNYMTQTGGKYNFFIESFEYPMNNVSGNIQVSLPFSLLYTP